MIKINSEKCVGCGLCIKECNIGYLSLKEPEHKVCVTGDRCIVCGHCEAVCPREAIEINMPGYEEFENFDLDEAYCDSKELAAFMANIRSVRNFRNKPVEQEKIDRIIEAGKFSPTGCNYQRTGYVVLKDSVEKVAKEASLALEGELTEKLSASINEATLNKIVSAAKNGGDKLFFKAPLVIILTDLKSANGVDIGIAASRMELIANAMGLGVCFNGIFPHIANADPQIAKLIDLPSNRQVVLSMVIGYPEISYLRPAKRKKANILLK